MPTTPARPRLAAHRTLRLTPLAAALALAGQAVHAAPAAAQVPVPAATWRVSGSGASAPVNRPNSQGGTTQTIRQDSARAIYQWDSFDIGATSQVSFDMAVRGGSALNRVVGSAAPSQIFGRLSATNNGQIFLINPNGILFGRGAQVNTGSLIASTLNLSDAEFNSGFGQSIANLSSAHFRYDGDPAAFVDSRNFVRVEPGASITTASGGQVMLFAKRVENAGKLSAPDGQVILGGGGSVKLKLPSQEADLYAAEENAKLQVLRGFLVEMGRGPGGEHGSVANLAGGQISTPRGNTTLVGLAVNQSGRISATTSVDANGSIILKAQSGADYNPVTPAYRATESGALTLGAGSLLSITPDTDTASKTASANATVLGSFVELAGRSVVFEPGSQLIAPGAQVVARAQATPTYTRLADRADVAGDPDARIVLGEGVLIDLSGTTTTTRSVADLFVTTELLGSNDLKDAPVQKDGLLYRAKVTIDTRLDSPILGSLQGYRDALGKTATEWLSRGGHLDLRAEGAVITADSSRIRLSGGQVTYTAAAVAATRLVAADGRLYDLATAPSDLVYTDAFNLQKSSAIQYDRWGQRLQFGRRVTAVEAGYVAGADAGSLSVIAPIVQLGGHLEARASQGERQQAGLDALAQAGRLSVGAATQNGDSVLATATVDQLAQTAVLKDFRIGPQAPQLPDGLATQPLEAPLAEGSGISTERLLNAGFAQIGVHADGDVLLARSSDEALRLADGGSLTLASITGDVRVDQSLRGAAASVTLVSKSASTLGGLKTQGGVQVADGVQIDLSGAWVNAWLGGQARHTAHTSGGRFSASGMGVQLGQGSGVDVSGGGAVSLAGAVTGAAAGSISLSDVTRPEQAQQADAPGLQLQGRLSGFSAASSQGATTGGGQLTLRTSHVRIGASSLPASADTLLLGTGFFDEGGFGSFSIDGRLGLTLSEGSVLAPQRRTWMATTASRNLPDGAPAAQAFVEGRAPGLWRGGMAVSLSSSGDAQAEASQIDNGRLSVGQGARIDAGDTGSIRLSASHLVDLQGELRAHGGSVTLATSAGATPGSTPGVWVGSDAVIDVSGRARLTPDRSDGLVTGQVLAGGTITLSAADPGASSAAVVVQQGARLDARGSAAPLDVTERSSAGTRIERRLVGSGGGALQIISSGTAVLEGTVALQAGADGLAGGSVSLTHAPGAAVGLSDSATPLDDRHLRIEAGGTTLTTGLDAARLSELAATLGADTRLSAALLQASGAADISLRTPGDIHLVGDVTLQAPRRLSLNSQALVVDEGAQARLAAAQVALSGPETLGQYDSANPVSQRVPMSGGTGTLDVQAGVGLVMAGQLVTAGVGTLGLQAGGAIQLRDGRLDTQADVRLQAPEVASGTGTAFTLEASGHRLAISGGDAQASATPSAGGAITLRAAQIEQAGVLRAPNGRLTLEASESLHLAEGSLTSVSSTPGQVLYGTYTGGRDQWLGLDGSSTRPTGSTVTAAPDKQITLAAPTLQTAAGSRIEAEGAGTLVASEFVAGRGGSSNVLAGGDGAFALLPSLGAGQAPYAWRLKDSAAVSGRQIVIRHSVTLGDGTVLQAGTYTLLPAAYAVLDGAFLLRPASGTTTLAEGSTLARTDGSVTVAARLVDAGTGFGDAQPSAWQLMSRDTALRYSELRRTDLSDVLRSRASQQQQAVGLLAHDGGAVSLEARQLSLQGRMALGGSEALKGRDGTLGIAGRSIQIDAQAPAGDTDDGVLHIAAASLNQVDGGAVVLGGVRVTAADGTAQIRTVADQVVFAQGASAPITAADVLATARRELRVAADARFAPQPGDGTPAQPLTLEGSGAAMRVAASSGATLDRSDATPDDAALRIGAGVSLGRSGGSVALDSTGVAQVDPTAVLRAGDLLLAAREVELASPTGNRSRLALTEAQTQALTAAEHLTLRAYERLYLHTGSTLGGEDAGTIAIDTPSLRVLGTDGTATVQARALQLSNHSGPRSAAFGLQDTALQLQARETISLGEGSLSIAGATQVGLQAGQAISLDGTGRLQVADALQLSAPVITSHAAGSQYAIVAGGALQVDAAPPAAGTDAAALGSALSLQAASALIDGVIRLPSGRIEVQTERPLVVGAQARLDAAGRLVELGTQPVSTAGGQIALSSGNGNLRLLAGSVLDVSAGGGQGAGGQISLQAVKGRITTAGQLRGQAGSAETGAALTLDAASLDTAGLDAAVAAGHFTAEMDLRQREGDLTLAAGTTLSARAITLSADQGALQVAGTLDARGADGGRIRLSAAQDVNVADGARLLAQATASDGQGGRVALSTLDGRIGLDAGSLVAVAAGSAGQPGQSGGRLELRARQQGHDLAIDPLLGQIDGASRIDVQAVKVYDAVDRIVAGAIQSGGALGTATIAADAAGFLGSQGEHAQAIAQRLAGARPAADLAALRVHAEAEVRAPGRLEVDPGADWVLPADAARIAAGGGDARHVGDTSLTLRATGSINLRWGITSGLDPTSGAATSDRAGNLTLTAGADLQAASARQLRRTASPDAANLNFKSQQAGRLNYTGSSTGDVTLSAAGNLAMDVKNTIVLSTGAPRSEAAQAVKYQAQRFFGDQALQTDGGDVRLQAGSSIQGDDTDNERGGDDAGVVDLLFGGQLLGGGNGSLVWGGSAAQALGFSYVGSFGGGQVDLRAGRHIIDMVAVAPSSGYHLSAADGGSGQTVHYGGGSLSVRAGGDVVSGAFEAGGRQLQVAAGGSVIGQRRDPGGVGATRLYYEDNRVQVDARGQLAIGEISDAYSEASNPIQLLNRHASARLTATAGDASLGGGIAAGDPSTGSLLPDDTRLAAASGDLRVGDAEQRPIDDGRLALLAAGDLQLSSRLDVYATRRGQDAPLWLDSREVLGFNPKNDAGLRLDQSQRTPVEMVARDGDVRISAPIDSARALHIEAGRDILVQEAVQTQLQPDAASGAQSDLVLLKAGRDIVFSGGYGWMRVGGSGQVLLLAGRDIDLGSASALNSSGLMAIGNQDNPLLASGSAQLTLVAGLSSDGLDYRQAVQQGFAAVGSTALAARAGDLYAFLSDATVSALGSARARTWSQSSSEQQLALARALLGEAPYQQALARYVRHIGVDTATLTDAQALAAFERLTPAQRDAAPAQLLAARMAQLDTQRRSQLITLIAAADTPRYAQGLQAWMQLRTGATLDLAQALTAFEALPLAQQVGWINQVLVEEVRSAGRSAAQASGYAQQAAYLRGSLAIDAVFAGEHVGGDLALPATQIKTLQDSGQRLVAATGQRAAIDLPGITLMTPAGGVNAGETGSVAQSANNLGVVTVAGGGIAAISRDDFLVNQSRVFTLDSGDLLIWSTRGDIDAGRGAKTVSAVPPPVVRLDAATGRLYLDTSGSYAGSGIAVGGTGSTLDLYAPSGAIDAGEAGIKASGNVFLGATTVRGADNIQVGGQAAGVSLSTAPVSLPASTAANATDAARATSGEDDDERRKRRARRRQMLLDFLGFGRG
ncbi:filamentous hemagglutinin family protein [Ideonella sp. 4Y16]|uniref:filamentous haemagglutinin family protein n=1 Tax=Ideonella alba TaxID=2824118 RepID=UPI001B393976|nr:filamentous haemagglutinin family protein [Ideonella alba]MBQ0942879.1 filamentous hemagglutinin family protein [Ideonella alba]